MSEEIKVEQVSEQEANTKFCKHCGEKIMDTAVICPKCGGQVEKLESKQETNVVINNIDPSKQEKSKWVAFLLCFFLGGFGAHKFYEGKVGMGILYLLTIGLFGIGTLIDLIKILVGPDPYYV